MVYCFDQLSSVGSMKGRDVYDRLIDAESEYPN